VSGGQVSDGFDVILRGFHGMFVPCLAEGGGLRFRGAWGSLFSRRRRAGG
jgi:hypothetical protein